MSTTNTIDTRITDLLQDVGDRIGADRVVDLFEGILDGAAKTRGSIEKSVDALLSYTNLPTRAEHVALADSVEAMAKRVEVLARRIERLTVDVKKNTKTLSKAAAKRPAAAAKSGAGARKSAASKTQAGKAKATSARAQAESKRKPSARGRR